MSGVEPRCRSWLGFDGNLKGGQGTSAYRSINNVYGMCGECDRDVCWVTHKHNAS